MHNKDHMAPMTLKIRTGEPEPVGAGCFWLLGAGAGAAWKKKSGAGAGKN